MKTLSNHLLLLVQTALFLFVALVAGCKHPEHQHPTTSPAETATTTAPAAPSPTTPSSPSSDHRLIAYIADWVKKKKNAKGEFINTSLS